MPLSYSLVQACHWLSCLKRKSSQFGVGRVEETDNKADQASPASCEEGYYCKCIIVIASLIHVTVFFVQLLGCFQLLAT